MMDGFVSINKEEGLTSNFTLQKFRRVTGLKKSGFVGTLDPLASGVLPIAFGKATKSIELMLNQEKEYIFTARFGVATDSGDSQGGIIGTTSSIPSVELLSSLIEKNFIGTFMQSPPVYSAVKYNGKRLCDMARKGESDLAEIAQAKAKLITVKSFEILNFSDTDVRFKVTCGKGTYVRKLATDLAEAAGSLAHIIQLQRSKVGIFTLENSVKISELTKENLEATILSLPAATAAI